MKLPHRQFLRLAGAAAALPAVSRVARSQASPSRPITIIVPYPAGIPAVLRKVTTTAVTMAVALGQSWRLVPITIKIAVTFPDRSGGDDGRRW